MGVVVSSRTPAASATLSPGENTLRWQATVNVEGEYWIETKILYRRSGGTWQSHTQSESGTSVDHSATVWVDTSEEYEWYVVYKWHNTYSEQTRQTDFHAYYGGADTTDPTLTNVTPATGNVAPTSASGVRFAATVSEEYEFASVKLYIDDVLERTWTSVGAKTYDKVLTKGAHTYRWLAEDDAGNTDDTGTVNINVTNVVPAVPSGTITVAGETGAVSVANLGSVLVEWPEFVDYNTEDSVTYTAEYQIESGGWTEIDSGLSTTSTYWTPDDGLGAAELRVKANDGTADSAYLTRTGITIVSSQSPNAPTLTSPLGGESWREGETHNVTWTPAATEHPEGLPCTYEIQFSADGTFADAVTITSSADDGTYPWTLATDLV